MNGDAGSGSKDLEFGAKATRPGANLRVILYDARVIGALSI